MKYLLIYLAIITLAACNQPSQGSDYQQALSKNDREFIRDAAENSMAEMALGRYASGRASDERLKDQGRLLLMFHDTLLREIKQLSAAKGVKLNDTLNARHQQWVSFFDNKAGAYFDSAYMSVVEKHYNEMMEDYQSIVNTTGNKDVRLFASEKSAALKKHLQRIIEIRDSINRRKG